MQNSASFKRILFSVGVALVVTLACFVFWSGTREVSLDDALVFSKSGESIWHLPLWLVLSLSVTVSVLTTIAIDGVALRRAMTALAGVILGIVGCSLAVSFFFAVDIQSLPILLGALISTIVIQGTRHWARDLQLTTELVKSAGKQNTLEAAVARSRLLSGLRLLDTVLRLNEAIVFKIDNEKKLVSAARLRPSTSGPLDSGRNSAWREGVGLCEQAMKENSILSRPSQNAASIVNVALPLRHERRTVGAILIRLNDEFEPSDRALLAAVGSQMARDLQREEALKVLQAHDGLGVLSAQSVDQRFESLYVLNGLLREQRFGMEALAEVADGIAIARLDGTLAFINPHLRRLANLTEETTDLFHLLDRFRTDVFDEPSIAVRRVLQTGEVYERELEYAAQNATYGLRIALIKSTVGDDKGEPLCLAVHVTDLTRAKEHEQLKSDMISLMSHELRTPLTSINGFAELLNAEGNLPENAKEFVAIIANESQRLSRMINTFLAVTKLERKDKQEVLKIPLRLDEVAREIVMTLQPVAKKRRIRLVEQPALRIPPVAADKGLITQAVKNLVSNAIKYSPERTTVTVSTSLEAEAVRVSVEDRGYGIPTEARDRVWEKFYRVVREGQEKDDESTGLGLSFVREVVEQHGGQVDLETEEGRGSKFSFTLPRL